MIVNFENDILPDYIINDILKDSNNMPWSGMGGKKTDNPNRIWMHQYDFKSFKYVCDLFTSNEYKNKYQVPLTSGCRIELSKDQEGCYLQPHYDDPDKIFTMQIYLTDSSVATWFDNGPVIGKKNRAWWFHNTGTELHGLKPLKENRVTIIINYVNDKWLDKSVLA